MKNAGRTITIAAATTAALALGLSGVAMAEGSGNSRTPEVPTPVVHRALLEPAIASPCKTWAVVESESTLVRTGCPGASTSHVMTGGYQVTFTKNIRRCVIQATLGGVGHGYVGDPGMINVVGRATNKNAVYVGTYGDTGVSRDLSFHLTVTC